MIDYGIDIGNVNGILGNYTGKNASGATSTDGTPFIAAMIDDIWGPKQALILCVSIQYPACLCVNTLTTSEFVALIYFPVKRSYRHIRAPYRPAYCYTLL